MKITFAMAMGVLLGLASVSCSQSLHTVGGTSNAASLGIGTGSPIEMQALGILSTNCSGCHGTASSGGISDILNVNHLVATGLIVPGNAAGSPLIQAVQAGRMPPGAPLNSTQTSILVTWVTGNSTTASPTPPPTLAQQAIAILTNNCASCHGTTSAGGVSQINNVPHLISAGLVIPGSATTSKIYQVMKDGSMPPAGTLSSANITAIATWINAGAPAQ